MLVLNGRVDTLTLTFSPYKVTVSAAYGVVAKLYRAGALKLSQTILWKPHRYRALEASFMVENIVTN